MEIKVPSIIKRAFLPEVLFLVLLSIAPLSLVAFRFSKLTADVLLVLLWLLLGRWTPRVPWHLTPKSYPVLFLTLALWAGEMGLMGMVNVLQGHRTATLMIGALGWITSFPMMGGTLMTVKAGALPGKDLTVFQGMIFSTCFVLQFVYNSVLVNTVIPASAVR